MDATSRGRHNAHALRPEIGELGEEPLSELGRSLCGPDDVPLEIDDLAAHFLLEATQATPSSLPPAPRVRTEELEASLGEACFEDQDGRAGQQAFERLWREIINRELSTTSR